MALTRICGVAIVGAGLLAQAGTAPPSHAGYALAWSEEFARAGAPDPANWTYELGFVRNQELQWYSRDNARVADGLLVIDARRARVRNPGFDASPSDWKRRREYAEYTSASLTTRGLHSWKYGRFEMRARIDTRPGLWPAFWTLGVAGGWPHNGEIDIMEYYPSSQPCRRRHPGGRSCEDELSGPLRD